MIRLAHWPCQWCGCLHDRHTIYGNAELRGLCLGASERYTPLLSGRALSFKQPWLHYMLHLPRPHTKTVENRKRPTNPMWGEALWWHASQRPSRRYFDAARAYARDVAQVPPELLEDYDTFCAHPERFGSVQGLGVLEQPNAPRRSDFLWIMAGQFHMRARVAAALPESVPCKGSLGVWRVPDEVLVQLRAAVGGEQC